MSSAFKWHCDRCNKEIDRLGVNIDKSANPVTFSHYACRGTVRPDPDKFKELENAILEIKKLVNLPEIEVEISASFDTVKSIRKIIRGLSI